MERESARDWERHALYSNAVRGRGRGSEGLLHEHSG